MSTRCIRVLIVDDHPIVRDGLTSLLRTLPDIDVVGHAESGAGAVECAVLLHPDVILMDIAMPVMNGLEATEIVTVQTTSRVLMLTMSEDSATIAAAVRAGAAGYILKSSGRAEIAASIRGVHAGQFTFGREVAATARELITRDHVTREKTFPDLSDRQFDVLVHLATGADNSQIAAAIGISPKTVANTISAILTRLRLPTRASAVEAARASGLDLT